MESSASENLGSSQIRVGQCQNSDKELMFDIRFFKSDNSDKAKFVKIRFGKYKCEKYNVQI